METAEQKPPSSTVESAPIPEQHPSEAKDVLALMKQAEELFANTDQALKSMLAAVASPAYQNKLEALRREARELTLDALRAVEQSVSFEPNARMAAVLERLMVAEIGSEKAPLRPRVGFLADGEHIENQTVDIIGGASDEFLDISFKLTAEQFARVAVRFKEFQSKGQARSDALKYGRGDQQYIAGRAIAFDFHGLIVKVPNEGKGEQAMCYSCPVPHPQSGGQAAEEKRSLLGLVHIEVPRALVGEPDFGARLQALFQEVLQVPEGITEPDRRAERNYRRARYRWHHKLNADPPDWEIVEQRLERREVLPGYHTFVESDKHKEYEAITPYAAFHKVQSLKTLSDILREGLLSTHERFRRGLIVEGMSSPRDLETGGGDSVFTRIVTEAGHDKQPLGNHIEGGNPLLVFERDVLDRTDWYAYGSDRYGSTQDEAFIQRQSPRQLFEEQKKGGYEHGNEQMFRVGIAPENIKAIACYYSGWREKIQSKLGQSGITEVAGEPVEALIKKPSAQILETLKQNNLETVGGRKIEEVATEGRRKYYVDHFYRMREETLRQVLGLPEGQNPWNIIDQDAEAAFVAVREKGVLRSLGGQDAQEILSTYGLEETMERLKNFGHEQLGTNPVKNYFSKIPKFASNPVQAVREELPKLGIFMFGGRSLDEVQREAALTGRRRVAEQLSNEGIDYVQLEKAGYDPNNHIATRARRSESDEVFFDFLKQNGIKVVGGENVARYIEADQRDTVIKMLSEAGITEVNGKPVEEFVVYAKNDRDLVDIAAGKPARSIVPTTGGWGASASPEQGSESSGDVDDPDDNPDYEYGDDTQDY